MNSKFVRATTSQPYNRFSLNFRVFCLVYLIVPYLFSYCKTAPKQLNQLNSNFFQLLLLNCSTKWADIFRVYYLTLIITIDYATVKKPYAWIVSFANSNTFSLVIFKRNIFWPCTHTNHHLSAEFHQLLKIIPSSSFLPPYNLNKRKFN